MYTACIFCHASLGENDQIEHFPIGRRLAFDSAKGRLWVVCQKCAQWNLTPIEERWEAVEDCERAYRSVRTRVSTSQIGLARMPDGLDLIRIGAPLRPEFAGWRFGDHLGLRRRDGLLKFFGGSAIAAGAAASFASAAGATALGLVGPGLIVGGAIIAATGVRPATRKPTIKGLRVHDESSEVIDFTSREIVGVEMRSDVGPTPFKLALAYTDENAYFSDTRSPSLNYATVTGQEAVRAARLLLPRINSFGASRRAVREAVQGIEDAGSVERFIPNAMARIRKSGLAYSSVWTYPQAVRLGLEMALHEEAERRAMEGELAELEAAWREAERIAGIADDLVLPRHVNVFMDKYRKRP
jgi:hypothetical protein